MSGGLKMLHNDISPSKDNLIFSSLDDIHIHTVELDISTDPTLVDRKPAKANHLKKSRANKSLDLDREKEEQNRIFHVHNKNKANKHQQQNLLLVQAQQDQLKSILKNSHESSKIEEIERYEVVADDDVDVEGQVAVKDVSHDRRGESQIISVEDDVDGRTSCCSGFREKRRLEQIIRKKNEERAAQFAKMQNLYKLEGDNKRILNLGWEELVQALQKRELSATAVLEAYIAKTLESTSKFNNVTEFIPQAFTWAKELDSLPEPKGPLHGVPFCVKDDNNVEGLDTTLGYGKRLYKPATETAVLVKSLMDLGAVPFCKTNVPQTLFAYGSDNPVFGATTNCINPKLSPGGSSSGTGSLVGSHGCPFGTGTDIGGSLRIPAHFNGVASIKPTVGRLSNKGVESSLPNLMGLTAVPGIIGQTPAIVSTVFKGISEDFRQHQYDYRIPPIPWDNALFQSKEKLRIGYFSSLPFFPAMGDTEEVVLRAKSSLESLGHTLVEFNMPDQYHYMEVIAKFLLADQNQHFYKSLKHEKVSQAFQLTYYTSWIPSLIQKFLRHLMNWKIMPFYSKRTSAMFGSGASTSKEMWDNQGEKRKVMEFIHKEWSTKKLDAVVCPLFPFAAPLINYPGLLPMAVVYAMIWNLVDYPAGVVPFGRETGKNYDSYDDDGDLALKMAKTAVKESIGAPIGVQVVAMPFKEEIVLRVLTELEQFSYKH